MDFSPATVWWVLAGLAVAIELATGTFYLLMVGVGLVAGAMASYLGFGVPTQIVVAAVIGGGGTAAWHWRRRLQPAALPAASNRDVNLDIGERVFVHGWSADRTARVQYRGSAWEARLQPGADARSGDHVVSAVEGNWLVLEPDVTPR